jgi:NAD(P)-dependent dehydrogenase (short-subunit alcohol dehydrogenase family)
MSEPRQVVVVTGASRPGGIGLAVAGRFAIGGFDVVVSDIGRPLESFPDYQVPPPDSLMEAAAELDALGPGSVVAHPCDVTSAPEVDALVQRAVDEFGRLDVMVNNAGISLGLRPVTEVSDDEWQRNIDVMATGTFYGTRAAARHMIEAGSGSIINMSSQAGKTGWPLLSAYSAAKFAIVGFTQSVARELGPAGVRVNAICPGTVDTPLLDLPGGPMDAFTSRSGLSRDEARRRQEKLIPLRRFARPDDIAEAAWYLASEAASFITGEAINVTGGEEVH